MRRFLNLLMVLALVAVPWAARAQDIRINPVPPGLKPQWTRIPGVPQVSWAPNLPTDVFRYRGKYYFFWADYFYRGPSPQGPWKRVAKVPGVFYDVAPAYFKSVKKEAAAPAGPTAPAELAPPTKAKIIDNPSIAPPTQTPLPPETTPAPPPKVM